MENKENIIHEENMDEVFAAEAWYFNNILKKKNVLSTDEQNELLFVYENTNNESEKEKAFNELIHTNQRLVASIAEKYLGSGLDLDDLVQEGNLGLMRAIEKFDSSFGVKLSTYATHWIRQSITRYIYCNRNTIRIPVYMHEKISKLKSVQAKLFREGRGFAPVTEIAELMRCSEQEVSNILHYAIIMDTISLSTSISGSSLESVEELQNIIPSKKSEDPADLYVKKELADILLPELKKILIHRDYDIICRRYGIGDYKERQTLSDISELYCISRERVRQIQERAENSIKKSNKIRELADLHVLNVS